MLATVEELFEAVEYISNITNEINNGSCLGHLILKDALAGGDTLEAWKERIESFRGEDLKVIRERDRFKEKYLRLKKKIGMEAVGEEQREEEEAKRRNLGGQNEEMDVVD